jgi:hypothetical protein
VCALALGCKSLLFLSLPFFYRYPTSHKTSLVYPPSVNIVGLQLQVVALNLAHRANKGRTAAVAAVLRAYDELVSLGGRHGCLGSRDLEHCCGNHVSFGRAAACVVPVRNFPHRRAPCRLLFPFSLVQAPRPTATR